MRRTSLLALQLSVGDSSHTKGSDSSIRAPAPTSAAYSANMDVIRFFDRLHGAVEKRPVTTWVPNVYRHHTIEFEGITPREWLHRKPERPLSEAFPNFDPISDFNFKSGGGLGVKQSLWINLSVAVSLQLLKDCPSEPLTLPAIHGSGQAAIQALQEGYAVVNNKTLMVHCSQFDHQNRNSRDNLLHYLETAVNPYHFRFNAVTGVLLPARLQPLDKAFAGRHLTKPEFEIKDVRAKHTQQDQVQMHSLWVSADDFQRLNLSFRREIQDRYRDAIAKFEEQRSSHQESAFSKILPTTDDPDEVSSVPKRTDLRIRRANRKISSQSEQPILEDRGDDADHLRDSSLHREQAPPTMIYFHLSLVEDGAAVIADLRSKERLHPVNTSYFVRGSLVGVQQKPVEVEASRGYQTIVPPDLAPRLAAVRDARGYLSKFWSSEKAAGEEATIDFVGMGSIYRQLWWNGDDFRSLRDKEIEQAERQEAIESGSVSALSHRSTTQKWQSDAESEPVEQQWMNASALSVDEINTSLKTLDVSQQQRRQVSVEEEIESLRLLWRSLDHEKSVNIALAEMHDVAYDFDLAAKAKGLAAQSEFQMIKAMKKMVALKKESRSLALLLENKIHSEAGSSAGPISQSSTSPGLTTDENSYKSEEVILHKGSVLDLPCKQFKQETVDEQKETVPVEETELSAQISGSQDENCCLRFCGERDVGRQKAEKSVMPPTFDTVTEKLFSQFCRENLFGRGPARLDGLEDQIQQIRSPMSFSAEMRNDGERAVSLYHRSTFPEMRSTIHLVENTVAEDPKFQRAMSLLREDLEKQKSLGGLKFVSLNGNWSQNLWDNVSTQDFHDQATDCRVGVLSLCTGGNVFLFRLNLHPSEWLSSREKPTVVPDTLRSLLQDKTVVKVGVEVVSLRDKLYRDHELPIGPVLDLALAAHIFWQPEDGTLPDVKDGEAVLVKVLKESEGIDLSRSPRLSLLDWSGRKAELTSEQIDFTADESRAVFLSMQAVIRDGLTNLDRTGELSKDGI